MIMIEASEDSSSSQVIVVPAGPNVVGPSSLVVVSVKDESVEPVKKRARTDGVEEHNLKKLPEKLEHRLGGILCCAVCLDLPRAAIYQVC